MKFTIATIALVASLGMAAPAPEADANAAAKADPWCYWRPGQSCWKAKRGEEVKEEPKEEETKEVDTSPNPGDGFASPFWCIRPGQSCWRKRNAEASADAEAWCYYRPGQSCWKAKRDAEPVAEANAEPWCLRPGQSCWKAKREADAGPNADAEAWCYYRPGQSCWKAKRDAKADPSCMRPGASCWNAKREAEAKAEPFCMQPGQSCYKRAAAADAFSHAIQTSGGLQARSAEAEASNFEGGASYHAKRELTELASVIARTDVDPDSFYAQLGLHEQLEDDSEDADVQKREPDAWCIRPGQSCWKAKREALPEAEADADKADNDKRWCLRPGQSCWKAKRAAEAVLAGIAERSAEPWCYYRPGQSCWKAKRDALPEADAKANAEAEAWCYYRPGQSCWKAKRDVSEIELAARAIVEKYQ